MTSSNRCSYSIDGEHHYGPRTYGDRKAGEETREVIACRCGSAPADTKAVRAALERTTAEQRRQRDLSRVQVRKAMEQSRIAFDELNPRLPL